MAMTRIGSEQARFKSSRTGEHILDTYMEACEKGSRPLYDLLDDLWDDSTGQIKIGIFEFRIKDQGADDYALQYRAGSYVDPEAGWLDISEDVFTQILADAKTYRNQAQNSATTATTQAGIATTQAGISTTQATNSANSATLSSQWATSLTPVSGGLYGARYYAQQAAAAAPQSNWSGNRDPLPTDDIDAGYAVGSYWVNASVSPMEAFICVDSTSTAAVWIKTTLTIDELQPLLDAKQDLVPRVQSVTSSATVTPTSANDEVVITAQAAALNIANPSGTMVQGQALVIRVKDNGTARAITWGSDYRPIGVLLPNTTVTGKVMYIFMIWNSTDTKFDVTGFTVQG